MKKELSMEEIEKRFEEINAGEPEELSEEEMKRLSLAESIDDGETIPLEEYRAQKEYSGKLMLRIPKELHKQLAQSAKENGVSLNQYALYKLAK